MRGSRSFSNSVNDLDLESRHFNSIPGLLTSVLTFVTQKVLRICTMGNVKIAFCGGGESEKKRI